MSLRLIKRSWAHPLRVVVLLCGLVSFAPPGIANAMAPQSISFELPRWKTGEVVRAADFAGQIVVLDFFAYWCVPCKRASRELEWGIQAYYESQGSPQPRAKVRVIAVNIEDDHPELTAEFIRDVGAEWVVNDHQGALLEQLGGAGTPFIVVLDGTQATLEHPEFQMAYRHSGFEGVRPLRILIDSLRSGQAGPADGADSVKRVQRSIQGPPVSRFLDLSFDALLASDLRTTSTGVGYGEKRAGTEWSLRYTHQTYGLDYEPFVDFDFLGFSERVNESYNGGQASLRQELSRTLTLLLSGGVYGGFTDYRSLWFANYYKQQFSFVPGYEVPRPQGFNVASGLRWEYQPTTGFIEAGFSYANNQIAPGYELDPLTSDLLRGRQILHTYSPMLKFENVLTRRIRTLHEFQLTTTTGRKSRYGYRGSVNVALGEGWVWRTSGGYTHEDPTLRAWFAGSTVELQLSRDWFVNIAGLYYRDSGEIENSLFISTAAPGLRTYQGSLGFRYLGRKGSSLSLSAGPLRAQYDPIDLGSKPFSNLYRNRTWFLVQAAWNLEF